MERVKKMEDVTRTNIDQQRGREEAQGSAATGWMSKAQTTTRERYITILEVTHAERDARLHQTFSFSIFFAF